MTVKKYLSEYPELVKEWHPTKNEELTPEDFTHGSKKKVWWLCPKGHSYESRVYSRAGKNQSGCPYCSGRRVGKEGSLIVLYPEVAKEWHPTKNQELTPKEVTYGTKKKVWWLCPKGHSYESAVGERTRKKPTGCPYCDGKKASKENNLLTVFPEIAKEWHPTENNELTPKNVTSKSDKKVWWLCPKEHSYRATIKNKTLKKSGCPYCSNKKASETNNLQILFPEIAKEWHPTKNKGLTPKDFTYGSHKEVWWLCPKGHSYKTTVNTRTNQKSGCNICSKKSSELEIRILSELKWFFDDVKNRYKIDGVEVDIFLPKLNIGIEYDGSYWHKDKEDSDLKKNKFLLSQNITLIRVREHPLKSLDENDLIVTAPLEKKDLDDILKKIYPFVDNNIKEQINTYFDKSSFVNEELFKEYRSYFPSPFPEDSLLKTHPLISSEWDYDKNYPLRPENFSYGSGNKFWWLCSKDHSYESPIINRTSRGFGCPYCSGHKVGEDNNLLVLFPEIAKEWHPTKNGELTPNGFTRGSNKKVWWLCPKVHSYEMTITERTNKRHYGCPYCAGKKASKDNNLFNLYPEIAKEWHPTKNGELTPNQVTYGSGKKIWWLCPIGHSYESVVQKRTDKNRRGGCPYCAGQKTLNYDLFK